MANELIAPAEAARRLGRNRSTVTRYLQQYPELNHGVTGAPKVDWAEFSKHYGENLNVDEAISREAAAPLPRGQMPLEDTNHGRSARDLRTGLQAVKLQIEVEEKLRTLVPRAEVEEVFADFGQLVVEEMKGFESSDLAERLAAMSDPRDVEALLRDEVRAARTRIASECKRRAASALGKEDGDDAQAA